MVPLLSGLDHILHETDTGRSFVTVTCGGSNAPTCDGVMSTPQSFSKALQALADSDHCPYQRDQGSMTRVTKLTCYPTRHQIIRRMITFEVIRIVEKRLKTKHTQEAADALIYILKTG